MAKASISRRVLLRATPALLAIPATALASEGDDAPLFASIADHAADPELPALASVAGPVPTAPSVPAALAAHRAALRAVNKACDRTAAIETRFPGVWKSACVEVGTHVRSEDAGGNVPIFAYSVDEIERHRDQWLDVYSHFGEGWEKRVERTRAQFADKIAAFLREKDRIRKRASRTGYRAAMDALNQAYRAEEAAFLNVLLAVPVTDEEARARRRHARRHNDADALRHAALIDLLIGGAGRAGT
jgi:hypothetical protein